MARTRYSEFKSLVRRFCGELGLGDWRVDFAYRALADARKSAEVSLVPDQKSAKIVLNRNHVPEGDRGWDLVDTALHEVCTSRSPKSWPPRPARTATAAGAWRRWSTG